MTDQLSRTPKKRPVSAVESVFGPSGIAGGRLAEVEPEPPRSPYFWTLTGPRRADGEPMTPEDEDAAHAELETVGAREPGGDSSDPGKPPPLDFHPEANCDRDARAFVGEL